MWETDRPSVDAICAMCLSPASRHQITRHEGSGWLTAVCASGVVSDLAPDVIKKVWAMREGTDGLD